MNTMDYISIGLMVILIGIILTIVVKIHKQNELVKNSNVHHHKNFKYRRIKARA